MIVVTGGAGFIGSNLVHSLNISGRDDIVVVDNLENGTKFFNIQAAKITDYLDQEQFLDWLVETGSQGIDAVFHLGASSDTTEWNGRYMMENNYQYSKSVLDICLAYKIPLIYASSAAVYGENSNFAVNIGSERPLNIYGYSKALFDQYVARCLTKAESQIVGLRYFNVYGPGEQHKGKMASVVYHHYQQLRKKGSVKLFGGHNGYTDGEQLRDFVSVSDAVAVNQWFLNNPKISGIYNVGTGQAKTFNQLAKALIRSTGRGEIEYIPFPAELMGSYQSYTQADISDLRSVGYKKEFKGIAEGVSEYVALLDLKNTVAGEN